MYPFVIGAVPFSSNVYPVYPLYPGYQLSYWKLNFENLDYLTHVSISYGGVPFSIRVYPVYPLYPGHQLSN